MSHLRPARSALVAGIALLIFANATVVDGGSVGSLAPVGAPDGATLPTAPLVSPAPVSQGRLAAGSNHTCLIVSDGTVRCLGQGKYGALGNGSFLNPAAPVRVAGLTDAIAIDAGGAQTCAVRSNGSVSCWGRDQYGELGDGGSANSALPVAVQSLTDAVAITAGIRHTCAIRAGGTAMCWGDNEAGELGNGTTTTASTPQAVVGLTGAVAITAGYYHTCALLSDGTVRCWGQGSSGALGTDSDADASTPQAVKGLTNVRAISALAFGACALRSDGTVWCWGDAEHGQLGIAPTGHVGHPLQIAGLTGISAISGGFFHACALRSTGTMACWGAGSFDQLGQGTSDSTSPLTVPGLANVSAIAAGAFFTCAIPADTAVRCWGDDTNGASGAPVVTKVSAPRIVPGNLTAGEVSAGGFHTCALEGTGLVRCWGANGFGQLGTGSVTPANSNTPVPVQGLASVIRISAGAYHSCALRSNGTVWCWGSNESGQLGNTTVATGSGGKSSVPVQVLGMPDPASNPAIDVSAGGNHTCAVFLSGGVACWGGNDDGQIGDGGYGAGHILALPEGVAGLDGVISISAGSGHTCAVVADGRVACWGANANGQVGSGSISPRETKPVFVQEFVNPSLQVLQGIVGVIARYAHSCAITYQGAVLCWGWNAYHELGNFNDDTPYATPSNIPSGALSIGPSSNHGVHTCAVKVDSTITCWGSESDGQLGDGYTGGSSIGGGSIANLSNAVQVSVGFAHSCALLRDGTARCFGRGIDGQLGNGSFTATFNTPQTVVSFHLGSPGLAVSAGASHTCALLSNGTARCWGSNGSGRLGDGTTTTRTKPVTVSGLTGAVAIAAGGSHTCAMLAGGTAKCWGYNLYGQLGNNSTTSHSTPVTVSGLSGVIAISADGNHTCALLSNGTVKCWGLNSSGQLGDGTTTSRHTPVTVKTSSTGTLSGVIAISAGTSHTCALLSNGTARCWGAGSYGRLGNGSTANRGYASTSVSGVTTATAVAGRFTSISAGGAHTCARIANGTARCWGDGASGRLGNASTANHTTPVTVSGLTSVAQVSAGGAHSCALLSNGTARCWGSNAYGQLGTGSTTSHSTPVTVSGLAGATSISAGGNHTAASLATGSLRAWGLNTSGQVGDGTTTNRTTPRGVSGL